MKNIHIKSCQKNSTIGDKAFNVLTFELLYRKEYISALKQ
ncbi:hypothetical protein DFO54_104277 [Erwinia sp. AG740]|nr:hypothetical protein DFO54_104277 [Erwinia sp. AG740]